ncbi:histone H1, gonadal-like protein [Anopheles sinensis]|uniref:Histone H1, gonadal-like protein n=1 Tax=Anopheles sinensis TaxID=74873 RepID=A0A084W8M4_ANOSI|nr:histone H1, gonadal-like protein [Anopheles sinensis]
MDVLETCRTQHGGGGGQTAKDVPGRKEVSGPNHGLYGRLDKLPASRLKVASHVNVPLKNNYRSSSSHQRQPGSWFLGGEGLLGWITSRAWRLCSENSLGGGSRSTQHRRLFD